MNNQPERVVKSEMEFFASHETRLLLIKRETDPLENEDESSRGEMEAWRNKGHRMRGLAFFSVPSLHNNRDGIGRPRWPDRDEAFEDVVRNLSEVIKTLLSQKAELARRSSYTLEPPSVEHQKIYLNETLVCRDCGDIFVFTAEEQKFYSRHGLFNKLSRCPNCRALRREAAFTGGAGSRKLYTVICAGCGIETQIPLMPIDDRPVYCSACYSALKTSPPN